MIMRVRCGNFVTEAVKSFQSEYRSATPRVTGYLMMSNQE